MMATYVKGDPVANATSYELLEKASDGTYNSLKESEEINFEVSALGLAAGDHILVVKAKADGYADSDHSNEVTYSIAASGAWLTLDFTSKTVQDYIDAGVLSAENSTVSALTYDSGGLVCNDTDLTYGLKLATPIAVAQNWTVEITMTIAPYADSGTTKTEAVYKNMAILSNTDDHDSHANTCLAPCILNNGWAGTARLAESVSTAVGGVALFQADGAEHTYKFTFDAATNVFQTFLDGASVASKTNSVEAAGNFGYVLGIHKGYSYAGNFKPHAGVKIKSVKVYS